MDENRRPLKVRSNQFVKKIATWLAKKSVTPNQISVASIFFAAFAGMCLLLVPSFNGLNRIVLYIFTIIFIQIRLLCNLFDGLVAVEGGKSTPSGELFNDIPDRISDPLIIVAMGYSITCVDFGVFLGWLGALLAVLTAYVRTLIASMGAPVNFTGPMAKQHRMALITGACALTACIQMNEIMLGALMILNIGCLVTLYRRVQAGYRFLES